MFRNYNWVKWVVYVFCAVFVSMLQFLPSFPRILGITPLLAVPCVVAVSMFEGENAGAAYGILYGLLWDMQSGKAFGYNALMLMIAGITVGLLVKYLFSSSFFSAFLFTLIALVTLELVTWFFFYYMTGQSLFTFFMLKVILPTVCYTVPFTIPVFYAQKWLHRKMTSAE